MKTLTLLTLLLLPAAVISAQTTTGAAGAPGITVTQLKWREAFNNPALTEDPLSANDEQADWLRAQRETNRQNASRERAGQTALPPPSRAIGVTQPTNPERAQESTVPRQKRAGDRPPAVEYVYEAKFSNSGAKAIKALVWEYVLTDPETQREVGKHSFTSQVNIRPGKSERLVGRSPSPPAQVVNVMKAHKKVRGQYTESVNVQRIEYADGTVWQAGTNE
jgi:hypothetical protein